MAAGWGRDEQAIRNAGTQGMYRKAVVWRGATGVVDIHGLRLLALTTPPSKADAWVAEATRKLDMV